MISTVKKAFSSRISNKVVVDSNGDNTKILMIYFLAFLEIWEEVVEAINNSISTWEEWEEILVVSIWVEAKEDVVVTNNLQKKRLTFFQTQMC